MKFVIVRNNDRSDDLYGVVVIEGNTSVNKVKNIVRESYDVFEIHDNLPDDCYFVEEVDEVWW